MLHMLHMLQLLRRRLLLCTPSHVHVQHPMYCCYGSAHPPMHCCCCCAHPPMYSCLPAAAVCSAWDAWAVLSWKDDSNRQAPESIQMSGIIGHLKRSEDIALLFFLCSCSAAAAAADAAAGGAQAPDAALLVLLELVRVLLRLLLWLMMLRRRHCCGGGAASAAPAPYTLLLLLLLCSANCSRRSARTALTQRVFIRFVPAFHDRYLRNEGFRFQLGGIGACRSTFGAISI